MCWCEANSTGIITILVVAAAFSRLPSYGTTSFAIALAGAAAISPIFMGAGPLCLNSSISL